MPAANFKWSTELKSPHFHAEHACNLLVELLWISWRNEIMNCVHLWQMEPNSLTNFVQMQFEHNGHLRMDKMAFVKCFSCFIMPQIFEWHAAHANKCCQFAGPSFKAKLLTKTGLHILETCHLKWHINTKTMHDMQTTRSQDFKFFVQHCKKAPDSTKKMTNKQFLNAMKAPNQLKMNVFMLNNITNVNTHA